MQDEVFHTHSLELKEQQSSTVVVGFFVFNLAVSMISWAQQQVDMNETTAHVDVRGGKKRQHQA